MSKAGMVALAGLLGIVAATAGGLVWLKGQIRTPSYCASCHVMAPYYNTWKSSIFLSHTHARLGMTCQDCHARTLGQSLEELVDTAMHRYREPLKSRTVRAEFCFRCHVGYSQLASLTENLKGPGGLPLGRNPHDSHWGRLECGICHKFHRASVDSCAGCHGFPDTRPGWTLPTMGRSSFATVGASVDQAPPSTR